MPKAGAAFKKIDLFIHIHVATKKKAAKTRRRPAACVAARVFCTNVSAFQATAHAHAKGGGGGGAAGAGAAGGK